MQITISFLPVLNMCNRGGDVFPVRQYGEYASFPAFITLRVLVVLIGAGWRFLAGVNWRAVGVNPPVELRQINVVSEQV